MKVVRKLKAIIYRVIVGVSILINFKKEPFISFNILKNYIIKGGHYPLMKCMNFREVISITKKEKFKFVKYQNKEYAYPLHFNDSLCTENLNAILNEQINPESPHKYIPNDEIEKDWIIYDLGTAEGYQAKQWSKIAKKIIIFEPSKEQSECLLVTFEKEIEANKVKIINLGLSDKEKIIDYREKELKLMDLDSAIKKYSLPYPNYIKVDIEGEEIDFLKGAKKVLKNPTMKRIDICVYHRPKDYIQIPKILSAYKGIGHFSEGLIVFNRNALINANLWKAYHPVFRKCLYTYFFGGGLN